MWPSLTGWKSRSLRLPLKRSLSSLPCCKFVLFLLLDGHDVQVNGVLLDRLVLEEEYVAVLFLGECEGEEKVPNA